MQSPGRSYIANFHLSGAVTISSTSSSSSTSIARTTTTSSRLPASTPVVKIGCPLTNNKNYTSIDATNTVAKTFLRSCDVNFQDGNGGRDIVQMVAFSMEECMDQCANFVPAASTAAKCDTVTWTFVGPPGTGDNFCWLKAAAAGMKGSTFTKMESARIVEVSALS